MITLVKSLWFAVSDPNGEGFVRALQDRIRVEELKHIRLAVCELVATVLTVIALVTVTLDSMVK